MFDNLCKSWPRESQQCINRLKNKQTSYRVLNTVLIKVLYERCGSWPQKCYGDGYSTGWLRHFIATRRYEFFNFRSAEARSVAFIQLLLGISFNIEAFLIDSEEFVFEQCVRLFCNVYKLTNFALPNFLAEFYFLYIRVYCILRRMLFTIL